MTKTAYQLAAGYISGQKIIFLLKVRKLVAGHDAATAFAKGTRILYAICILRRNEK